VLSAAPHGKYMTRSGTSQSAPMVSAVVADVVGTFAGIDEEEVYELVRENARVPKDRGIGKMVTDQVSSRIKNLELKIKKSEKDNSDVVEEVDESPASEVNDQASEVSNDEQRVRPRVRFRMMQGYSALFPVE